MGMRNMSFELVKKLLILGVLLINNQITQNILVWLLFLNLSTFFQIKQLNNGKYQKFKKQIQDRS